VDANRDKEGTKIQEVLAKGDCVIVLVTESPRRNGREWSSPQVHPWTVKNGKATSVKAHYPLKSASLPCLPVRKRSRRGSVM
jgi:ketosteroid isomerase-like protein